MIQLRPANINDMDLVKYWDTKQHVIDCDPDEDWDWETELERITEWREQFIAELDGIRIGFLQIIDPHLEETHYWGEIDSGKRAIDIWIGEESNLNKGYGTEMMQIAIEKCFNDHSINGILVDPLKTNTKAHRFYERLGFEFVEEREFEGNICFVFELRRSNYKN
jgi:aminoglycoside 6'-N-acetyltransferase